MTTFNNGDTGLSVRTKINAAIDKVDGATPFGNNITFGDNNKAIFGAGSDLQIYHDGSGSYIDEQGSGPLYIRGSSQLFIQSSTGENYLVATANSGLNLRYNNNVKLATTSTGVDVTGTVTADGLTVGAAQKVSWSENSSQANSRNWFIRADDLAYGDLGIKTAATAGAEPTLRRMNISREGDISFYEDTGTTAKFFWDASAEALGIGTSSPSQLLEISSAGSPYMRVVSTSASGSGIKLRSGGSFDINIIGNADTLQVQTGGSERLRIDSSGNLLVGTTLTPTAMATTTSGTGFTTGDNGLSVISRDAGVPLYVNRLTSDGDIAVFRKDGSTVGSIGTKSDRLFIADDAQGGIGFASGSKAVYPVNSGGSVDDAALTLGGAYQRFKDLYLSGDITLGASHFIGNGSGNNLEVISGSGENLLLKSSLGIMTFGDNSGNEYGRFDSSGSLLMGVTSVNDPDNGNGGAVFDDDQYGRKTLKLGHNDTTTSYRTMIEFHSGTGAGRVGFIASNNSVTAYNTSSDYRLKEDVQPMSGASDRVLALNPVNFAWKADGSRVDGFLAHEAQAVVPEAVSGEKDAVDADGKPVYQGIDQSKLVPLLTAALQEALQKIEALEARVTALEA